MKKYLYLIILLSIFVMDKPRAQNSNQPVANQSIKRTLIKDLHTAPMNSDFKGAVIFNDRLLETGLTSIASFPVDTVKTITYFKPLSVTNSLIDVDSSCQFGILVLNTSSADPAILPQSVTLSNLEQILLNSKKILYKNENQEPD